MHVAPYALWSIWRELSTLYRLFVLILVAVSIYSLISASIVLNRIHTLRNASTRNPAPRFNNNRRD